MVFRFDGRFNLFYGTVETSSDYFVLVKCKGLMQEGKRPLPNPRNTLLVIGTPLHAFLTSTDKIIFSVLCN